LIEVGLEEGAEVVRADAFTYIEHSPECSFDYVYIAPPQYKKMWFEALRRIDRNKEWLSADAWVIVQIHPIEYEAIGENLEIQNLVEFDQRSYGSTLLVFYERLFNDSNSGKSNGNR
jgi:16S rRNA G966 N2-methylase RsmD